jgi:hypothetical protein
MALAGDAPDAALRKRLIQSSRSKADWSAIPAPDDDDNVPALSLSSLSIISSFPICVWYKHAIILLSESTGLLIIITTIIVRDWF